MSLYAVDPPDDAELYDVHPHADEELRAVRWDEFVTWCRGDRPKTDSEWSTMLFHVFHNMNRSADWHYERINAEIMAFQEAEGWPGVLRAVARAMEPEDAVS